MKPLVILGSAIVGGLLIFFVSDEMKKEKNLAKIGPPDPENDSDSSKLSEEDLDRKVRELRKALRHAERERKAIRGQQNT